MIGYNNKSRRHFLIGAGQFALALPFLSSLAPEKAWAGIGRKKFVSICQPNGVRYEHWEPKLAPNQYFDGVRIRNMTDFAAGGINQTLGTTFNNYLSRMTYIKGLDVIAGRGHNPMDVAMGNFTDADRWDTIDQVLAQSKKFYQGEIPALRSVHIGEAGMSARWLGTSYIQSPGFQDPTALFNRIFFSSSPADKTRNLKIVDRVLASFNKVKAHSRLSTEDKQKMQNFVDLLNQTENRIDGQRKLEGLKPGSAPTYSHTSTRDRYRIMNEMAVLALSSEATQVVTIAVKSIPMLNEPDGFTNPFGLDGRGVWHEDHHVPDYIRQAEAGDGDRRMINNILIYNQWWAQNVILDLIKQMDAVKEDNGQSLLDNSLVYWGNEMSYGLPHANFNQPVVLFGGAAGSMETGRYLDYSRMDQPLGQMPTIPADYEVRPGRMYNQFLVSILQTMGLTELDYMRGTRKGYGVVESLRDEQNKLYAPVFSAHSEMLPRFRSTKV